MSRAPQPPRVHRNDYSVDRLRSAAAGRWREILSAAGMSAELLDGRRGRPCPRCGGVDRFAPMPDLAERGAVICRSCFGPGCCPSPGDGIATLRWWLGLSLPDACRWLGDYLGGVSEFVSVRRVVQSIPIPSVDPLSFGPMCDRWRRSMPDSYLRRMADLLGLPCDPLASLGVGWSAEHRASSWPMRDGSGDVIGIRLRCPETAKKWAITGSRAGLFYVPELLAADRPGRLWVVEGPTDTAALLSIGCDVVGCPSAGCGGDLLAEVGRRVRPAEVIIIADADGPGVAGAERLADALLIVAPVRLIAPAAGFKDARAWVVGGASHAVLAAVADASLVRSVVMEGV